MELLELKFFDKGEDQKFVLGENMTLADLSLSSHLSCLLAT